jgi:hypothetical protein
MVKITHSMQHITQIEDGFITFEIKATFELDGLNIHPAVAGTTTTTGSGEEEEETVEGGTPASWTNGQLESDVPVIFVGFKNSAEILNQLQIVCRGKPVGLQDNECLREAFAYNIIRSVETKKKRFDHSLWEHVDERRPGVCGTYIPIRFFIKEDLTGSRPCTVTFEINLPVTDILSLQAFTLYPNFCLGDIELKFYTSRVGLVWAECSPIKRLETLTNLGFIGVDPVKAAQVANYTGQVKHQFTQIANSATIITGFNYGRTNNDPVTITTGLCTLRCTDFMITRCKSTILGFNVRESSKLAIQNFFATPRYIPAQELAYYAFPHPATANGFQSSINVPLHNCNCISFMFPKNGKDRTVFENINYQNVQCTIANTNFPSDPFTTVGARFLQYQLIASDLDGPIEPSKEYIDSIAGDKVALWGTDIWRYHNGVDWQKKVSDETSFMINIQLERSGAEYCFDGLDTGGQNIAIQLKGNPIKTGVLDTYYCAEGDGDDPEKYRHPCPPEVWICQETYWKLSNSEGLVYMRSGNPPNTQVEF